MKTKLLVLVTIMLALASCGKDEKPGKEEQGNHASGYTEQDWDWNDSSKCQNGGIRIDTAWDSDTTINF